MSWGLRSLMIIRGRQVKEREGKKERKGEKGVVRAGVGRSHAAPLAAVAVRLVWGEATPRPLAPVVGARATPPPRRCLIFLQISQLQDILFD